jgi:hypothetical protein
MGVLDNWSAGTINSRRLHGVRMLVGQGLRQLRRSVFFETAPPCNSPGSFGDVDRNPPRLVVTTSEKKGASHRCPGDTSLPSSDQDGDQHSEYDRDNANCVADLKEQQNGATNSLVYWTQHDVPGLPVTAPEVSAVLVSIVLIRAKCKQVLWSRTTK